MPTKLFWEHQDHQDAPRTPRGRRRSGHGGASRGRRGLKVHRALGPGLLESAYEHCLAREFELRGLPFRRQVPLPIVYEGAEIDVAYRLDLLVAEQVIVEVKAVDALTRAHEAQLLTYLKFSGRRLGLLMNFNVTLFKDGVRRLAR